MEKPKRKEKHAVDPMRLFDQIPYLREDRRSWSSFRLLVSGKAVGLEVN